MTDRAFKAMSLEEYLRTEESSPVKREYVNGFVYAVDNSDGMRGQAGSSMEHDDIAFNILAKLKPLARAAGCRAHGGEIKLRLEQQSSFYYPDVSVACGERPDRYSEKNPCLLVEVLSRGAAHTARHAKYAAYTAIPGLQTYLIVDQYRRHVYAYQRQSEGWYLTEYVGTGEISSPCLGTSLSLHEIYADVLDE